MASWQPGKCPEVMEGRDIQQVDVFMLPTRKKNGRVVSERCLHGDQQGISCLFNSKVK